MKKICIFAILNLILVANCSNNPPNKLENIDGYKLETKVDNNGKLLQDVIIFFDKRITWLEENIQGLVANYTSCCKHLVYAEIDIAQLKAKIKSNEEIVNQIKKITIDEL